MFSDIHKAAGVCHPQGFKAAGVRAGIKKNGNLDVAVIYTEKEAAVAGVFTKNLVAAAPVHLSKIVVGTGTAHAVVANAGCANACTGEQGIRDAEKMATITAKELNCRADDVIVASTGLIGANLPMDKMEAGIKDAVKNLSREGSVNAGNAIITTDTCSKMCATEVEIGGVEVRFGAIAKGSGMIRPDMATMLCFITTDADIDQKLLQQALRDATEISFNMISVDGDMSTNDSVVVLANGAAGNKKIVDKDADYEKFYETLKGICVEMAKKIAADGEGATKFVTINVTGAENFADAKKVGMAVANSPLVKTAFFGQDANPGRTICAVGYSGVKIIPEKISIKFGGLIVYDKGLVKKFDEDAMKKILAEHDIVVDIELGLGDVAATVYTCDLSYRYVAINSEYCT
ncbi:MAG: bifunctional glutamate N-acetyltransferase/amino-acid acetyltransferase ArgJ [Selenomonadaceae bacterium]|nr:bifunctional glutamate N-acetyltransferase/amino-acid acetyltransferase ArgJ [Selenomonadaceae bacterium]MBQ9498348.1 bifunctional glutamate N-acetyltransferase/amino-acid acetyltransferase ArgJ [Selenomonadaceae bacterium]